ncbi:glycosyltransferase family 39 protein [Stenotrophomonas mori]|uniref:Glycosyltransferase family 39 protein n=1 Tax=Stenotrophomonas mori TaxID=2871096 RepID=A0ABT0SD35_9GAMM|nr:glycosyltransferase family 39 protein [Stenotrophomonas mori]MCL7713182.1 glycosyltransferase family 39 protein [Stenotrophomonas mori]
MLLALIVLLAAWLRIDAALETRVEQPIRADAAVYVAYAYNLHHFATYSKENTFVDPAGAGPSRPDAFAAPGYPALLSLLIDGHPDWDFIRRVMLLQALLGTAMVPLTYLIGLRLVPRRLALLPALLVALSPKLIAAGTYLLTETLFTALLLASLAWIIFSANRHRAWMAFSGGVLLAATALVRPTLQYILPFLLIALLPTLPKAFRLRYAIAMTLGFVLVTGAWATRNLVATGQASDQTLAISALVHGHYPFMMYDFKPESRGYPYRFDPQIATLSESMPAAVQGIAKRIRDAPATYLHWYLAGKPLAFLAWSDPAAIDGIFTYPTPESPYHQQPLFKLTLAVMRASHWLWVGLFLVPLLLVPTTRWRKHIPDHQAAALHATCATGVYFILIHMAGFPIARYNIPLLPVIFLLATYTLAAFGQAFRTRRAAARDTGPG